MLFCYPKLMLVWATTPVSQLLHSHVLKESTRELLKLCGSSPPPLALPSSDSTIDSENTEAALLPSLMTIILLAHENKYLLRIMHLLLILLKLDSLFNQAIQSATSMLTIVPPTGMNFEATYQTALSMMTMVMHIMVSQSATSLLDLTLSSLSTSITNNRN